MTSTTFDQLKKLVDPVLKAYTDDLNKTDRGTLKKYKGPFLYGYRESGTDLLMLTDPAGYEAGNTWKIQDLKKFLEGQILWITYQAYTGRNTHFLYFDGVKFRKVNADRINQIWKQHSDKLLRAEAQQLKQAA